MFYRIGLLASATVGIAACADTGSGVVGSRSSDSLSPFYAPSLVSYEA